MKSTLKFCTLLIITLSLLNCATTPLKSDIKILNYYSNTPKEEDLYWGIGMGKNLPEASQNSRIDIATQLYTKIYEEIIRVHTVTSGGKEITPEEESYFKSVAKLQTNAELYKVKRLDYKTSLNGSIGVLSYLNNGIETPFNEETALNQIDNTYRKRKILKLSTSFILPGTGQLLDGEPVKGGLMLAGAAGSAFGFIYSISQMQASYRDYQSAPNNSTQQYYLDRWESSKLLTIVSGILYLLSGAVSAIDFEANSF